MYLKLTNKYKKKKELIKCEKIIALELFPWEAWEK